MQNKPTIFVNTEQHKACRRRAVAVSLCMCMLPNIKNHGFASLPTVLRFRLFALLHSAQRLLSDEIFTGSFFRSRYSTFTRRKQAKNSIRALVGSGSHGCFSCLKDISRLPMTT